MLYRILTETIDDDRNLRKSALRWFPDGHTILHGRGCWHGGEEPCTILEICGDESLADKVREFAEIIADRNRQDSVLVQSIPCSAEFIWMHGKVTV